MKCFNHPDRDSVGVCRICGKALCKECAVSTSFGLSCKGDCEKSAQEMAGRLAGQRARQGALKAFSGYYTLALGVLLSIVSLTVGKTGFIRYIILIPCIGLIVWGITLIRRNKKR